MSPDKPIDKFIEDQKNKNNLSKTRRDVSLLTEFLHEASNASSACLKRQTKTALRSDKLNFIGLPILNLLLSLFSNEQFHI